MVNVISLKNYKRFEKKKSLINMKKLTAEISAAKLSDQNINKGISRINTNENS